MLEALREGGVVQSAARSQGRQRLGNGRARRAARGVDAVSPSVWLLPSMERIREAGQRLELALRGTLELQEGEARPRMWLWAVAIASALVGRGV